MFALYANLGGLAGGEGAVCEEAEAGLCPHPHPQVFRLKHMIPQSTITNIGRTRLLNDDYYRSTAKTAYHNGLIY